ncbi:hypothetical protein [Candidatus Ferrigenium straubiae]|jgi:hypothetical protein
MTIDTLIFSVLATLVLLVISIYANKHRSEDGHKSGKKHQNGGGHV